MCAPGCIEHVRAKLSRHSFFEGTDAWLPSGRWGLESVANLDKVPPRGATLVVGAPKIKGATGGPTRVMALI